MQKQNSSLIKNYPPKINLPSDLIIFDKLTQTNNSTLPFYPPQLIFLFYIQVKIPPFPIICYNISSFQ